jgi:hypothetical protein
MSDDKTPLSVNQIPQDHNESIEDIRADIQKQPIDAQKLLEGILELMKDPNGRRLFLRMITVAKMDNVRPVHWSKAANAPYYRQKYAEELRPTIDEIFETKKDRIFLYAEYPNISRKTLQLKCFQAFDFLVREMDTPEAKYRTARENIIITKEKQGIRLSWAEKSRLGLAEPVLNNNDAFLKLMRDVEKFVDEEPEGSVFERKDLQLSEDEIERLKLMTQSSISLRSIVEYNRIKILKLTAAQVKMFDEFNSDTP